MRELNASISESHLDRVSLVVKQYEWKYTSPGECSGVRKGSAWWYHLQPHSRSVQIVTIDNGSGT